MLLGFRREASAIFVAKRGVMIRLLLVLLLLHGIAAAEEYPRQLIDSLEREARLRFPRTDDLGDMDIYQMRERGGRFFALTGQGLRMGDLVWALWAYRGKRWQLVYSSRMGPGDPVRNDPQYPLALKAAGLNPVDGEHLARGFKGFPSDENYPAWKERLLHDLHRTIVRRRPSADDAYISARILPSLWIAVVEPGGGYGGYEVWQWINGFWVFRFSPNWSLRGRTDMEQYEKDLWQAAGFLDSVRIEVLKRPYEALPHGWL
jgi:hypothetical protein